MHVSRLLTRAVGAGLALALPLALTPHATAAPARALGENSLAAVLTSDGDQFDSRWGDFDITTEAVLAVLAAKPTSKVAVLADGSTRATAFVPTDKAFQRLGRDVLGRNFQNEGTLFRALVKNVGVRTIEKILLYHVVPGRTLTSDKVLKADHKRLTTALGNGGKKVTVDVVSAKRALIFVRDLDRNDRDARVLPRALDLNKGNKQVAHGISRVLRPFDL